MAKECVPGWTRFSLAKILVLVGAGGMAPPAGTRISARLKGVQGHSSHLAVNVSARRSGGEPPGGAV